ncbi:MAG: hypothetical protein JJU37_11505 [Balneolaceae bacterium]|nr:hypothetical protein [Balneolaceae bacterium]
MKNSPIIIAVLIISPLLFSNCDRLSQNREQAEISEMEADRDLNISRDEVAAEIQTFRIEMAGKIRGHNRSIATIKRRITGNDGTSGIINEARIIELEAENRELRRTINNYSDLSRHNWDQFKEDFSVKIDNVGSSLNAFFEDSASAN